MKIAYLCNQYPMPSHTWMRRELCAVEVTGVTVLRYSIRRPPVQLHDTADVAEADRTRVLLDVGVLGLMAATLRTVCATPARFARALALTCKIGWGSDRGLLRNFVYLSEACVLRQWLRRDGVEHVHAHFGTNPAAVAMLCRTLRGPTYSFTVHGPDEFDRACKLSIDEKVARAAFVATISNFARSQVLRWCDPRHWNKVHIVRCGVDDAYLAHDPTPIPNAPRLVCVARLSAAKGHLQLLDAVARLAVAGREFELFLVGEGDMRQAIEDHVRSRRLADRVTLTGTLDGEGVREQIKQARAMVLPSFAEGLPVVIMEAMALGRPVIATNVAAVADLVEPRGTGWLIAPGSVDELVEAISSCLDTPAETLAAMGSRGRDLIRQRHDVSIEAAKLTQMFRAVVAVDQNGVC